MATLESIDVKKHIVEEYIPLVKYIASRVSIGRNKTIGYDDLMAVMNTIEDKNCMVKGLRRRPLTAETRVRFPYWLLKVQSSKLVALFLLPGK